VTVSFNLLLFSMLILPQIVVFFCLLVYILACVLCRWTDTHFVNCNVDKTTGMVCNGMTDSGMNWLEFARPVTTGHGTDG